MPILKNVRTKNMTIDDAPRLLVMRTGGAGVFEVSELPGVSPSQRHLLLIVSSEHQFVFVKWPEKERPSIVHELFASEALEIELPCKCAVTSILVSSGETMIREWIEEGAGQEA